MCHGDGAETGDGRHQRFLLGGEGGVVARIDENRSLRERGAKRRGNQNSRRNQGTQRVLIAADRDGDGFSGRHGTLRQIGGEADGLAVMPSPEGIRHLRRFGGYSAQLERSLAAQENRNHARTQEQPKAISQGLNDRGYIRRSMKGGSDLSQDFGAAVLLARSLAEPCGFQQAAELAGQDGGLGGGGFIKKSFIRVLQERCRADDFIEDHQRSGHQGAGFELERRRESRRRLHLVDEDRAADAYGLGGDRTLLAEEAEADGTGGQLCLGLFSGRVVAGAAGPTTKPPGLAGL